VPPGRKGATREEGCHPIFEICTVRLRRSRRLPQQSLRLAAITSERHLVRVAAGDDAAAATYLVSEVEASRLEKRNKNKFGVNWLGQPSGSSGRLSPRAEPPQR
jgi:hypothetical protein